MEKLIALLKDLEDHLKQVNPQRLNYLQSGLPYDQIDEIFNKIGIGNKDLRELYHWRNGIDYHRGDWGIGDIDIFSFGTIVSLKDAVEHYNILTAKKIFEDHYFPIFTNGGGDFIIFDLSEKETDGMLWLQAPTLLLSEYPRTIFDSLECLFATTLECYREGAYKFDETGYLTIDYDLEYEIGARHNPRSLFWKSTEVQPGLRG